MKRLAMNDVDSAYDFTNKRYCSLFIIYVILFNFRPSDFIV